MIARSVMVTVASSVALVSMPAPSSSEIDAVTVLVTIVPTLPAAARGERAGVRGTDGAIETPVSQVADAVEVAVLGVGEGVERDGVERSARVRDRHAERGVTTRVGHGRRNYVDRDRERRCDVGDVDRGEPEVGARGAFVVLDRRVHLVGGGSRRRCPRRRRRSEQDTLSTEAEGQVCRQARVVRHERVGVVEQVAVDVVDQWR